MGAERGLRMFRVLVAAVLLAPLAAALPTPGLGGASFEPVTGRIFPEALRTNDYVSFDEALAGLAELESRHPERLRVVEIGKSAGWNALGGGREPSPVLAVEVTNEDSSLPWEAKLKSVFLMSVHGNEKGGREGALRVIEDLASGKGILEEEPGLEAMLDYQALVFVFPNPDGWTHEELQYRLNDACYVSLTCPDAGGENAAKPGVESQNFVRTNGNGIDLNRQYPTIGYLDGDLSWRTMKESEIASVAAYGRNLTRVVAGADVHGMLTHDHYFMIMLKDGERTQEELFANERLAELLKERINANPYYVAWSASPHVPALWGGEGEFAEWASTFDSIGYSASGTGGAWVVQDLGLDAPGFTIELAYAHIAFDNYYPVGAVFNDYHVRAVRDMTITFMEFASEKIDLSVATNGVRLSWLSTDFAATNKDDDKSAYAGWFVETDADDAFDLLHRDFEASPNEFWLDLATHAADGDRPGVVSEVRSAEELVAALPRSDTVAIPGSAAQKLLGKQASIDALGAWVRAGGRLVLTDEALQLLAPLGLVEEGDVDKVFAYSGYTDLLDRSSWVAENLRGFPRQTYDPNPLGFGPGQSPVWFVAEDAFNATEGEKLGVVDRSSDGAPPASPGGVVPLPRTSSGIAYANRGVNLGTIPLGSGVVAIFGAVLPDPTEETPHPYGLDGYAVSAAGNLLLLNLLGYEYVYDTPPVILDDLAKLDDLLPGGAGAQAGATDKPVPGASALLAAAAAGASVALARRRR